MSVLTAILQAIGQALSWIFPISESGHSAIFHNFSDRFTNACSQLTGVIHIGIAIGIFLAFLKFFIKLFKSFFSGWIELFQKKLRISNAPQLRKFMYMTVLSFVPMIFYVIPTGKYGNFFLLLHKGTYDTALLGEGICFALTGALLMLTAFRINERVNQPPIVAEAIIIGIVAMLALPTGGCSLVAGVFCVCVLMGMSRGIAYKYAMVMSFMVLLVSGIVELCIGVTKVSIVSAIIALVISAGIAFLAARILKNLIKKDFLSYIAIYDLSIGVICAIIGIFQIILK